MVRCLDDPKPKPPTTDDRAIGLCIDLNIVKQIIANIPLLAVQPSYREVEIRLNGRSAEMTFAEFERRIFGEE